MEVPVITWIISIILCLNAFLCAGDWFRISTLDGRDMLRLMAEKHLYDENEGDSNGW